MYRSNRPGAGVIWGGVRLRSRDERDLLSLGKSGRNAHISNMTVTPEKPAAADKPTPTTPAADGTDKPVTPEDATAKAPKEIGGREGLDPTRYGDWEKAGRCVDF